ncbi:hypothetical protein DAI22_03g092700 [Oryza sativa Japonica Group]|nr:hypothetical protein DAI22_03g092700 [Oryza sativa Japonica Group]
MRKGYGVSSHMAAPPIHILLIKCANLISHLLHHVFDTPGLMPNIIPSFFSHLVWSLRCAYSM